MKCFEGWVIAKTEKVADEIVNKYPVRCVSVNGNQHSKLTVTGGYRPQSSNRSIRKFETDQKLFQWQIMLQELAEVCTHSTNVFTDLFLGSNANTNDVRK
jgi:hypothetical protein